MCVYLSQAVSLPPLLGIEWDLFRRNHRSEDVEFEPVVVSWSVAVPLWPATSLQSRPVRTVSPGLFLLRMVSERHQLPSEMDLGSRIPAHKAVRL